MNWRAEELGRDGVVLASLTWNGPNALGSGHQTEEGLTPLGREAVRALPEELRSVIVLRYFTGLTLEETAAALEIPRGTVSSRQRRALELLRLDLTDGQEVGS